MSTERRRFRIVVEYELEPWWGADDAYEAGGEQAVLELIDEDPYEILKNGTRRLYVEPIPPGRAPAGEERP